MWLVPYDDSIEILFGRLILTGMFIPLGLTFCIIGVKRIKE